MFICENCGNKDLKFVGVDKFNKLYCRLCVSFKKEKVSKKMFEEYTRTIGIRCKKILNIP